SPASVGQGAQTTLSNAALSGDRVARIWKLPAVRPTKECIACQIIQQHPDLTSRNRQLAPRALPVRESNPCFSAFTSACARDVRARSRAGSFADRGPDRLRYFALNDSRNNVILPSRLSPECFSVVTDQRTKVEA